MPQMAPMMWLPISLFSFFMLIMIVNNIYFYSNKPMLKINTQSDGLKEKKNWKW